MARITALVLSLVLPLMGGPAFAENASGLLIGRGMHDITGPAAGTLFWGYAHPEQIGEGIHFRLRARAFVIAEPEGGKRIAFVSADLGHVSQSVKLAVVERLQARYGELYSAGNVVLSATHTHSGPVGHNHRSDVGMSPHAFYPRHFEAVVGGIVAAIAEAHADLAAGRILLARGRVEGAGANRSLAAYRRNPAEERARYDDAVDREMTLLRFERDSRPIGLLNWLAVHPVSMTRENRLISGDNKGYASYRFERRMGTRYGEPDGFVAAFAQSNEGDVTPNLDLDGTGPTDDQFENTRIIGRRQAEAARALFDAADRPLSGPVGYRHVYLRFDALEVADEYTGEGAQRTCRAAHGYAFAAGTEDGRGHPWFHEGMTERRWHIDLLAGLLSEFPDDALRRCQAPKAVLFPIGLQDPALMPSVLPAQILRVGQLAILAVPAELTTMAGRRLRATVAGVLSDEIRHVVIAGLANAYAGYVTTRQEYRAQHYEGGHTLFGPYTLAAWRQSFASLARAMVEDRPAPDGATPLDLTGERIPTRLGVDADRVPEPHDFGDLARDADAHYHPGQTVRLRFWTGHPQNDFRIGETFLAVERREGGEWRTVATDADWRTRYRWRRVSVPGQSSQAEVIWRIPEDVVPGMYRIRHFGDRKDRRSGRVLPFSGVSRAFRVDERAGMRTAADEPD